MLIGSYGRVHLNNYYKLISDYFDEVLVVSDSAVDFCPHKVIDFSLKNPRSVFQNIRKLREIMLQFSPTVVHVHQANSYAYITSRANKGRFPQVLTTWGSDVLILPNKGGLYKHIVSYSLKKSDYVTADAKFMEKAIHNLVKKEVLIANFGIEYKQEVIPNKTKVIYSNRSHESLYRVNQIIEGFSEFVRTNPSWRLVVGANGAKTDELKLLAKDILPESSYEFIGFVNSVENKQNYLNAHIWISNPESDGTAISLLEAMGYGCVPVVSDLPANNEWIKDGENGVIIGNSIEESIEKAANLNLELVQNLNEQIIKNQATKEVNKAKFINLYNQIIHA